MMMKKKEFTRIYSSFIMVLPDKKFNIVQFFFLFSLKIHHSTMIIITNFIFEFFSLMMIIIMKFIHIIILIFLSIIHLNVFYFIFYFPFESYDADGYFDRMCVCVCVFLAIYYSEFVFFTFIFHIIFFSFLLTSTKKIRIL